MRDVSKVEELLWSWPSVCKAADTEWSRGFALSIMRQSRRRNWRPTEKQMVLMQRMVAALYERKDSAAEPDDFPLIEGDE